MWDLLAGGRLVATISNHRGNITCLALDDTGSRYGEGETGFYVLSFSVFAFLEKRVPPVLKLIGMKISVFVLKM